MNSTDLESWDSYTLNVISKGYKIRKSDFLMGENRLERGRELMKEQNGISKLRWLPQTRYGK